MVEELEKDFGPSTALESQRRRRYVNTVENPGEAIVSIILLVPLTFFLNISLGLAVEVFVLALGVSIHIRYVRRAVAKGEVAFSLATRFRGLST
ncbi:MAG: hypothetical protein QXU87_01250 [Candidatus Caldarchaeum sp.]